MHAERVYVRRSTIEKLLKQLNHAPIVAVGTTSLRTLESLYWFGRQLLSGGADNIEEMSVTQWEPYMKDEGRTPDTHPLLSSLESLNAILHWMNRKEKTEFTGYTQIMIAPGYSFKIVDILVTNFHLPQSTLLLLIAAFIGEDWHKVYDYALQHDFRFLSYGDSSLLFRKTYDEKNSNVFVMAK